MNRGRWWTSTTDRSTMDRHGLLSQTPRASALLPGLSLYRCFARRADALFELTDALLSAGTVPSPVHLSLASVHRRGWGSLYAALSRGQVDQEPLRDLLARHPLGDRRWGHPPVYAVDVSVWDRCDAEASPERGFYYHPSRHSAGQPIVA